MVIDNPMVAEMFADDSSKVSQDTCKKLQDGVKVAPRWSQDRRKNTTHLFLDL